jgi:hypothetical protein
MAGSVCDECRGSGGVYVQVRVVHEWCECNSKQCAIYSKYEATIWNQSINQSINQVNACDAVLRCIPPCLLRLET